MQMIRADGEVDEASRKRTTDKAEQSSKLYAVKTIWVDDEWNEDRDGMFADVDVRILGLFHSREKAEECLEKAKNECISNLTIDEIESDLYE